MLPGDEFEPELLELPDLLPLPDLPLGLDDLEELDLLPEPEDPELEKDPPDLLPDPLPLPELDELEEDPPDLLPDPLL